jgi:predicted amidohydrolase YtcJ
VVDLVLYNGRVLTVDAGFRVAQAIAVRDGRIAAVGTSAEMLALAGTATRRLDLSGRTLLPGLIDGHAHMDREGLKEVFPSLAGARSVEAICGRIATLARAKKPGEWIVTMPVGEPPYYWDLPESLAEGRFPDRWDLDRAAPENPVYIRSIWGFWRHTMPLVSIANSRALALAGIDRHTVAPISTVEIGRDFKTGEPNGQFLEWTMMPMVELSLMRVAPSFTAADRAAALPRSMAAYHAFGTTSVFEEHGAAGELIRAYMESRRRSELTMRTTLVASPNWRPGGDAPPAALLEAWGSHLASPGLGDDWLKVGGLILEVGGSAEHKLRLQAAPYTGWAGFNYDIALERRQALEVMIEAARLDIRMVGIWPNVLELYEEVNRVVPIDCKRWVLGHISSLTPAQVDTIARLGLVLTTHTNRYVYKEGHLLRERLGKARENEISPLRTLRAAGIAVSLATDNVPTSMFYPIWQAVSRYNRYAAGAIAPDQALSREDALRAATVDGAFVTWDEKKKGSLEPGKLADFAVLDRDPLTVPIDELKDIRALATYVGGREVYRQAP